MELLAAERTLTIASGIFLVNLEDYVKANIVVSLQCFKVPAVSSAHLQTIQETVITRVW